MKITNLFVFSVLNDHMQICFPAISTIVRSKWRDTKNAALPNTFDVIPGRNGLTPHGADR